MARPSNPNQARVLLKSLKVLWLILPMPKMFELGQVSKRSSTLFVWPTTSWIGRLYSPNGSPEYTG